MLFSLNNGEINSLHYAELQLKVNLLCPLVSRLLIFGDYNPMWSRRVISPRVNSLQGLVGGALRGMTRFLVTVLLAFFFVLGALHPQEQKADKGCERYNE